MSFWKKKPFDQRLGASPKKTFVYHSLIEKEQFNQHLVCATPNCWSKYTTTISDKTFKDQKFFGLFHFNACSFTVLIISSDCDTLIEK